MAVEEEVVDVVDVVQRQRPSPASRVIFDPLAVAVLQTPLALALALPLAPQLVALRHVAAVGAVVVVGAAAAAVGAAVRRGGGGSGAAASPVIAAAVAPRSRARARDAQLVLLALLSRAAIFFWICARFSTSSRADLQRGGGGVNERAHTELRAGIAQNCANNCAAPAAAHRSAM